jgi:hypothetical protein
MNQAFWTTLGQYLSPVLNAEGEKVNWINYKTGERNIRFAMQADQKNATIGIELSHKDAAQQNEYFEKFIQLKKRLEEATGEQWQWKPPAVGEYGKTISTIYTTLPNVSVFNKADWPLIISFFKTRIIALDKFWSENKVAFER